MSDETKLPKVVTTRETSKALTIPDRAGECHPMNMGRHGALIPLAGNVVFTGTDWRVQV